MIKKDLHALSFISRRIFWELVVFIEQNGVIIDAELSTDLNDNELRRLINFKAVNSQSYELANFTGVETVQYDSLFSFYTTSPIRYEDIAEVQDEVLGAWTTAGGLNFYLLIPKFLKYDSYIYKFGLGKSVFGYTKQDIHWQFLTWLRVLFVKLGLVVQSIITLTSSLRVISLSVLPLYNQIH